MRASGGEPQATNVACVRRTRGRLMCPRRHASPSLKLRRAEALGGGGPLAAVSLMHPNAQKTRASRAPHGRSAAAAGAFPGGHRRGVTPVPIPNTEVKPSTADGTARGTAWESRSLPGVFSSPLSNESGLFLCTGFFSERASQNRPRALPTSDHRRHRPRAAQPPP
jgi:hypothetical protein